MSEVAGTTAKKREPLVGVIMGSDSDLPTLQKAIDILTELAIPHEVRIVSAHRTPLDMAEYGRTARERGLKVIVAGAGGAAHLPGMVAAHTTVPVIGVPVPTEHLRGLDSLLSIVQMPGGIPVATVAIGGATNAGLLAAEILATSDGELAARLDAHRTDMAETSRKKNSMLARDKPRGKG
jgi:5-(carboxyamino)imidazole ribonucleotide mutase